MPPTLAELEQELDGFLTSGKGLLESITGEPTKEQAVALRDSATKIDELTAQIEEKRGNDDAQAKLRQAVERERLPIHNADDPAQVDESDFWTPGEAFTRSESYAAWMKRFPSGAPARGQAAADPVAVKNFRKLMGMRTATERFEGMLNPERMRTLISQASGSAGTLVWPNFMGLLEPGLVRPLVIRQLLTVIPVATDTIEYVRESSRVFAAAPVADASALTGTSGTKPEGGLTFAIVTDVVRTIAEWVPATRRILADAPQLRAYIDEYLTSDLAIALENQVISGSGVGENLLGILNTPGILTAGPPAGTQNNLDMIRKAKRLILTNGRTYPTGVVLNPADGEAMDTLKASGTGNYFGAGPFASPGVGPTTLWGIPVVESEAVPAGTALVGDFRRSILFDRDDTSISVGTVNDDFIRNIVRVLAEARYGFGVLRPTAFCAVTLA